MSETLNKTQPTTQSAEEFINNYPNPKLTADYHALDKLLRKITGCEPVVSGRIIGYGTYKYTYDSGHSGEFAITGFAPSKAGITLYFLPGFDEMEKLSAKLGYHRKGKSCLYLQHLGRINMEILEEMITKSVAYVRANYKTTN